MSSGTAAATAVSNTLEQVNPRNLFIGGIALSISCLLLTLAISNCLDTPTEAPINYAGLHGEGLTQWVTVVVHSSGTHSVGAKFGTLSDAPPDTCLKAALPKSSWVLYQQTSFGEKIGNPWARSSFEQYEAWQYGELGDFEARRGRYALQIIFPREIACLERWQPRIVVNSRMFGTYQELGRLCSLALKYLGFVGLALLPLAFFVWIRGVSFPVRVPLIFPELGLSNCIRFRRQILTPIRVDLPDFGLYWGMVLWVPMLIFMALPSPQETGFAVHVRPQGIEKSGNSPWRETLGVFVSSDRKYFVNAQPVERESLRDALTVELRRHPVSTVYFEADEGALTDDAIFAMKAIEDAGGDLVWITPQIRKQLNQTSAPAARK